MSKSPKPVPAAPVDWPTIRKYLKAAADSTIAAKYARIAKGCTSILGIAVPDLREMARLLAAAEPPHTPVQLARMADQAFASGCREEILLATFLLARRKKQLTHDLWPKLNRWVDALDNWETCDQLATGVAAEIIARSSASERAACVADLDTWTKAASSWRRRFALATTVALNQRGRSDAAPALRICERLLDDDDDSVRTAVGWALREACKSDAPAVFAFLKKHAPQMSRTMLRESARKLSAPQRSTLGVS